MTPTVDLQGAADLMKIHPKSVQDKIAAGELPAAKVGRAYVLMTRDVLEYVERQIVKQTAERLGKPTKASQRGPSRASSRIAPA
jgi:excisionase family DNA binding protein